MPPQILLLSAAGLLLLCPTLPVAKRCVVKLAHPDTLGQHGGFISYVACNYADAVTKDHGYDTRVVIKVIVAKSMEGWEMNLQFANTDTVRVKSVRGGQVIGGETRTNGSVIFRNRIPRLDESDSFRVSFRVRHGQPDGKLFPARLHVKQPSPRLLNGMCTGSIMDYVIQSSDFARFKRKNTEYITYRLSLGIRVNHGATTCRLNFNVPARVIAIQHAQFVGQIDDRQYVIRPTSPTTDIDYQIVAFDGSKHGFNFSNTHCRRCLWDKRVKSFRTVTLPPYTPAPATSDASGDETLFPITELPTSAITPSRRSSTDQTERPSDDQPWNKDTPTTGWPSLVSTITVNTDQGNTIVPSNEPGQVKSDDRSSSSHSVWIGVAVGCAIGLIVLIVVVVFLLVSRRSSSTPTAPQLQLNRIDPPRLHNNVYSQEAANGHATCNGPETSRQLPCTPTKGDYVEYEELEVFCPKYNGVSNSGNYNDPAKNGDPSTAAYDSLMLPGQRLNLPQNNQYQTPPGASVPTGHYSIPRPARTSVNSIVESGDEDNVEESTYMAMNSPNKKGQEQDA